VDLTGKNGGKCSVVFPLVAALAAAVENGRGLISRADLNLHKVGALTPAVAHIWTLD